MNTGTTISGRPAMGSWLNYGLGSESENLPGFVVLTSLGKFGQAQPIAARQWHSGFLPSRFQGVEFHSQGRPGALPRPTRRASTASQQRDVVDAVQQLNQLENDVVDDPEIATRISAYETAFRMQTSVPELIDLSRRAEARPRPVRHRRAPTARSPPTACWPAAWPSAASGSSSSITATGTTTAASRTTSAGTADEVDQGAAALIKDLKQRGMLDDTLVIWGGEFGRTPMAQGNGRDHHIKGFSIWMAGGGIKGGITTARPTSSATPPSRTSSTSTTCTPRSSTSSASTTPNADLSVPGPRLPPDRRRRPGRQADPGVRNSSRSEAAIRRNVECRSGWHAYVFVSMSAIESRSPGRRHAYEDVSMPPDH